MNETQAMNEQATSEAQQKQPRSGTKEEIDSIQESLMMEVCDYYGRQYEEGDRGQPSMRAVADKFSISPMKVKKILVTGGLYQTETSDEIQRLYACGYTVKQISRLKGVSVSNVNSNLPYEKVIYNLDVRNEGAVKTLEWRNSREDRIIGRPTKALQALFNKTVEEFQSTYDKPMNVVLAVCNAADGAAVLLHFIRQYGFEADVPMGMPLEQYVASISGHTFMYGSDADGNNVDGILLRDDKPDLKETIVRMLSQIYCRKYEVDGGFFYRENCENETGDPLEQKIMRNGYSVWSGYITQRMTDIALGLNEDTDTEELAEDIEDVVLTGSTGSMSWVLINAVRTECNTPFEKTIKIVEDHGDEIGISRDFIRELGREFLIESQTAQVEILKKRQ